jgi:hypothetical protein
MFSSLHKRFQQAKLTWITHSKYRDINWHRCSIIAITSGVSILLSNYGYIKYGEKLPMSVEHGLSNCGTPTTIGGQTTAVGVLNL